MAMKRRDIYRLLGLLLCALLLLPGMPVAQAAESGSVQDTGRLSARFLYRYESDGQERAIPGVTARLYQVAAREEDASFAPCDDFRGFDADWNAVRSQETWAELAAALETYVKDNAPAALAEKTSGSDGVLRFEALRPGLYLLLCGEGVHPDVPGVRVSFQTALLSMPYRGEGGDHLSGLEGPDTWDYDYTVLPKPVQNRQVCRVQKIWTDGEDADGLRPRSLDVELQYEDGVKQTVRLSAENGWLAEFEAASLTRIKTVRELNAPQGYECTGWEQVGGTVQISNTHQPQTPSEPELPQTGLLWWPVPVLLVSGVALMLFGWLRRRHNADDAD